MGEQGKSCGAEARALGAVRAHIVVAKPCDIGTARSDYDESAESLPNLLEDALAALYFHDATTLFARLAPDCSIIVRSGEVIHGRDAFREATERLALDPLMRLEDASLSLVGSNEGRSSWSAVVAGSYRLYTGSAEPMIFSAMRRVTACFRKRSGHAWEIFHLHLSDSEGIQVDGSLFPLEVSRETYEYVRRILCTGRRSGMLPSRIVVEDGTQLHYLDPGSILYVQAQGKRCVVQTADATIPLNRLLGDMENLLGGSFVRTHRSYLVNTAHIASIARYELTLTDGTQLPVPKQCFDQVRREIDLRVAE